MRDAVGGSARDLVWPGWVPEQARMYLRHTEAGAPIRALAREKACHASTVLRQIRTCETRRDDLLVDQALRRLGRLVKQQGEAGSPSKETMMAQQNGCDDSLSETRLEREALRILRRMCEPGALLAVAADMDKAVVVRDTTSGTQARTAVADRDVAEALALKGWISCGTPGRISRYRITGQGRSALGRLLAQAHGGAQGFADAQVPFSGAGARPEPGPDGHRSEGAASGPLQRGRGLAGETPLIALARRRDKNGRRFLSQDLVRAGERLREDFELAHMGAGAVTMDWSRFLTGPIDGGTAPAPGGRGYSAAGARARVEQALHDLGPGLGDIALCCCCHLEGLERAEKRMGWSARSGKIVLRIALQRLKRFYDGLGDEAGMIG